MKSQQKVQYLTDSNWPWNMFFIPLQAKQVSKANLRSEQGGINFTPFVLSLPYTKKKKKKKYGSLSIWEILTFFFFFFCIWEGENKWGEIYTSLLRSHFLNFKNDLSKLDQRFKRYLRTNSSQTTDNRQTFWADPHPYGKFWIEMKNFFWKQYIFFIWGQNLKFRQDNALQNLYVFTKIIFFEDGKKPVGQCWFGARPLIFSILPHKYTWMTSDQKVL